VVVFAIEAAIFVVVGLSLPTVVQRIDAAALGTLVRDGAAVVATVVVVRFAWTFVVGALPRLLRARLGRADGPPWVEVLLVGFTGMRGAVSVAAALAIPLQTDAGEPLPGRDLIIFLTYVVVVVTVVGQGLALPRLLRRIAPEGPGDQVEREEDEARVAAARAALHRLDELGDDPGVPDRTLRRLRELYRFRLDRFAARLEGDGREDLEEDSVAYQRLRQDLLERERRAIIDLRDAGRITDDALRRVEHDLDLDESRLELSEGAGPHAASPLQLGDAD
jgi:CPA1 family monovalent cation:H+ antiporter